MTQHKPDWLLILGASAGGLEALEAFFKHCPSDLGCAYVVIQHLSPDYKSIMDELLARYTAMPVVMVKESMQPEANTIYLIPAGTTITLESKGFKVVQKTPHQFSLPIDIFLHSAARLFKQKAITLIFSGTGSDGSQGALDIHREGGFVIAQEPDEAKFDGMPRSVINTGIVDVILKAADMPGQVSSFIQQTETGLIKHKVPAIHALSAPHDDMQDIVSLLQQYSHINFHEYKPATIERRIERRMQVQHVQSLKSYLEILLQNEAELTMLVNEILIPVTSFFRDTEVWEMLATEVLPELVKRAEPQQGIRCWAAGVSTGEEAYSLAMLLLEACEQQQRFVPIKIFATDINPRNIEAAATGHFDKSLVNTIQASRLEKFFDQTDAGYQVKPILRQSIVFARHNLLTDAPFTRMDIVFCRNVLIYFAQEAQQRVLSRLQFAVNQGGYLLLGSSESLGNDGTDFSTVSQKLKLFRREGMSQPGEFSLLAAQPKPLLSSRSRKLAQLSKQQLSESHLEISKNLLIQHFAPPSLLVDSEGRVSQFFGGVQDFIRVKQGAADLTLAKLLPEKLIPVATALLYKARKEQRPFLSEPVLVDALHQSTLLMVQVLPVESLPKDSFYLVSLIESVTKTTAQLGYVHLDEEITERMSLLETELQATRENLQATIEELETANEELQATNEELMASNEELQSANEELQSVNEELNTVNAEYHEKVLAMQRTNADLDTMSRASGIATVFLDEKLVIRRYTHDLKKLFKIRDSDLGRPIDEVVHLLDYPQWQEHLQQTLQSGLGLEQEVTAENGHIYLVRMLPYQVKLTDAKGLVVSFVDITALKVSAELQTVINALPEHIAVLDATGAIQLVNRAWQQFAKANGDPELRYTGLGSNYLSVCQQAKDETAVKAAAGLKAVLEGSSPQFTLVYPCHSPQETRWFVMHVKSLEHPKFSAVVSHFNITAYVEANLSEVPIV